MTPSSADAFSRARSARRLVASAELCSVNCAVVASDSRIRRAMVARVSALLAGMTRRQRWPRKEINGSVPMRVGSVEGKLVDVSYGGMKFELGGDEYVLRSPVDIDFPRSDLRLQVDVVWSARGDRDGVCVFGASLTHDPSPTADWRAFVDRLE